MGISMCILPSKMTFRQAFSFVFASLLLIFMSPLCSSVVYDGTAVFPAIKQDEKVNLSLYYETLCPACATFIVNDLVKVFQKGLINIVNLRFVPWGNAELVEPNNTIVCQHGEDECYLNTIHACAIEAWPELKKHFKFIHCLETETVKREGRILDNEKAWETCCQNQKLSPKPIHACYNSGLGRGLELQYSGETGRLNPPHEFVPWVTVNGIPIGEDFLNFVQYVCKAYKGHRVPEACKSLPPEKTNHDEATIFTAPVCYAKKARLFHIFNTLKTIPRIEGESWIKKNP